MTGYPYPQRPPVLPRPPPPAMFATAHSTQRVTVPKDYTRTLAGARGVVVRQESNWGAAALDVAGISYNSRNKYTVRVGGVCARAGVYRTC